MWKVIFCIQDSSKDLILLGVLKCWGLKHEVLCFSYTTRFTAYFTINLIINDQDIRFRTWTSHWHALTSLDQLASHQGIRMRKFHAIALWENHQTWSVWNKIYSNHKLKPVFLPFHENRAGVCLLWCQGFWISVDLGSSFSAYFINHPALLGYLHLFSASKYPGQEWGKLTASYNKEWEKGKNLYRDRVKIW